MDKATVNRVDRNYANFQKLYLKCSELGTKGVQKNFHPYPSRLNFSLYTNQTMLKTKIRDMKTCFKDR